VLLGQEHVKETLEHVSPKHIGNDLADGTNWALACLSCNHGKGDALAWSAVPWAHDSLSRTEFANGDEIGQRHRWVILRRSSRCECGATPGSMELWVYKRVRTGLPIPSNCGATCEGCAASRARDILRVRWCPEESLRRQAARR
jgi:hypothetical protein